MWMSWREKGTAMLTKMAAMDHAITCFSLCCVMICHRMMAGRGEVCRMSDGKRVGQTTDNNNGRRTYPRRWRRRSKRRAAAASRAARRAPPAPSSWGSPPAAASGTCPRCPRPRGRTPPGAGPCRRRRTTKGCSRPPARPRGPRAPPWGSPWRPPPLCCPRSRGCSARPAARPSAWRARCPLLVVGRVGVGVGVRVVRSIDRSIG